jgi:hypothetical protein
MVYKLVLSPESYREIELVECYFRANHIEKSFLTELNNQFIFLEKFPLSRQIRYKNVRIHLLTKFNYSLHYTVNGNQVYVLHFLNQNQDF